MSRPSDRIAAGGGVLPSGIAEAEALFQDLRRRPPACEAAFRSALACVAPRASGCDAVLRAGLRTVREIERLAAAGGEHAYHNRHHVAETMLAMGWLCALADDSAITPEAAALGVLAMAGHDLGHDGSRCLNGRLEVQSADAMGDIAAATGLDQRSNALVRDLILASMPAGVQAEGAAAPPGAPHGLLQRLTREADVFASLLPGLGWRLGFALRREWRVAGDPVADEVVSFGSRCRFLKAYGDHTDAAGRIGLATATRRQLGAFRIVGTQFAGNGCSATGAVVLDRLRPSHALGVYRAALARA